MKLLNQVKKYSIGAIIVSLIAGILFLVFPDKCITYTSLAVGIGFIVMGIAGIVSYLLDKSSKFTLVLGCITLIVGIVVCIKYQAIITIIVAIFGIFILATGIFNAVTSIRVIASSLVSGWLTLVLSIITCVFGVVAITKSTQLTEAIVRFIGIALIVYGVLDIISYIQVRKIAKDVKTAIENNGDIETQGTIIQEVDDE